MSSTTTNHGTSRDWSKAWSPEFFGIVEGADIPTALTANVDDCLAAARRQ